MDDVGRIGEFASDKMRNSTLPGRMVSLPSLIRFHRRQAGLSQVELAELAGVSRRVVQDVESGGDGITWRNLCAILRTLNVTLIPEGPLVADWKKTAREEEGVEVRT